MIGLKTLQSVLLVAASTLATPGLTMSGAAASEIVTTHHVSWKLAHDLVGEAVRVCAGRGYGVTAVVVDTGGVRQAELRGEGAGLHTVESAYSKAFTALSTNTDTITLVEQFKSGPVSSIFAKHPNMQLSQGGVVLRLGEEAIGAIGVGGAPGQGIDTECARAAIASLAPRFR